jgi:hypothetical protein
MATDRKVKESLRKAAQKSQGAPDEMLQGRARGLGRSLSDILAGSAEPESRSAADVQYGPGKQMLGGLNALIPSGGNPDADFGPYNVDLAPEYFQGPTRSTRVAGHQFVPVDDDWRNGAYDANTLRGHIYVRFQRKTGDSSGTQPGDLWKYGECSLSDYRSFRETYSKGRAIRTLEAYGHGRAFDDSSVQI